MNVEYCTGIVLAVAVAAYLLYALVRPERF